jgi:Sulfotransferase family
VTGAQRAALPTCVVIGAMKCGTSALHRHLDRHPEIAMAGGKELNFFFGPDRPPHHREEEWWTTGQWHRGVAWYAAQHDPSARVRGESSPGYTDPSHPEVPARMGTVLPGARLVCLVRDPVARAVSQWEHHTRDGTECRPVAEAVLDPASQYLERSRYAERLAPFRHHFSDEQLLVVVQERLLTDPRRELARVYGHVGADPGFWDDALTERVHVGGGRGGVPDGLAGAVWEAVGDDVDDLRALLDDAVVEWPDPRRRGGRADPRPPCGGRGAGYRAGAVPAT